MKPLFRVRERAYGGKAGVWFRRKKRDVAIDKHVPSSSIAPTAASSQCRGRLGGGRVTPESASIATETSSPPTSENAALEAVIGWDDRPVFSEESNPQDDSEGDREAMSRLNQRRIKKTRSYGYRNPVHGPPMPVETMQSHDGASASVNVGKKSEVGNGVLEMSTLPFSSPMVGSSASICVALNSVTKRVSPMAGTTKRRSSTGDNPPPAKVKRHKQSHRTTDMHSTENSSLDFADEVVGQPSSKTSIVTARAFFERLDATQKLTLDASDSPIVKGRPCVRTQRKIDVSNDELREEYDQYVVVSDESGVPPLTIEEYAKYRSTFFRKRDIFDGFLDE